MTGRQREVTIATSVLGILLLAWLGFFVHRSPRFAGSGVGAIFGIGAALLMLAPLGYTVARRVPSVGARIASRVPTKTLMTVHVYAGLVGAVLAIIHTGHRFDSWLGVALVIVMLLLVVSGVAVRYLLAFVASEVKEKLTLLQTARGDLDNAWGKLDGSSVPAAEVTRIAESVADLEYSVRMHETFKLWFGWALQLHILLSVIFYSLLALHIVAGVRYGLRWLG
jgi:uncharacterized membrane protein YsdA (DUF1294 family)